MGKEKKKIEVNQKDNKKIKKYKDICALRFTI